MKRKRNPVDFRFIVLIGSIGLWWILAGGETTPASEIRQLENSTDPQVWIDALGSGDRESRNYARENILEAVPFDKLGQVAMEASRSSDHSTRLAGLWILSHVEADGRGEIAASFLNDADSATVKEALEVLAEDPVLTTHEKILLLVDSSDNQMVIPALKALAALENPDDMSVFISRLGTSNPEVREAARQGVLRLAPIHPDIVSVLLGSAQGDDLSIARESLSLLGRIGSENALDGLFRYLEYGPVALTSDAAGAIGQIGGREAAERALDLYINGEGRIRSQAARVLGVIGYKPARDYLWAVVQDESADFWLRFHSMEALATCGDESLVPGLITLLDNPIIDRRLVRIGIEALGGIDGSEVIDLYDGIIAGEVDFGLDEEGTDTALIAAVQGLGRMNNDESRERLRTLVSSTDPDSFDIFIAVVQSLGHVGTRDDIDSLLEIEVGKPVLHTFVTNAVAEIEQRYPTDESG